MKKVLLIVDNPQELDFIEFNLLEDGFNVFKCVSLKEGLAKTEAIIPDLIVVNITNSEKEIVQFCKLIKSEKLKDVLLLCLIELENYLSFSSKKHLVIKPVRPKLLLSLIRGIMNREEINWALLVHHEFDSI